ncbi:uncharacterized protein LOC122074351 [Macadamia integrifolia]|uniref:uncharacterized protein LOC122074351 n=1 Tax=Macadamia integrifolia TaxID=60698 RepID=UPI001C4EF50A|nr:uncharacterized protein LOC122074351 [Macadamia integrifolia]
MVDDGFDGEIQLFNPVSKRGIQLPSLSTIFLSSYPDHDPHQLTSGCFEPRFIYKSVLSSDPRMTKDYVVVAIVTDKKKLVYYKAGGGRPYSYRWISMATQWDCFQDVIYHKGKFYAVSSNGPVITFEFSSSEFPIITEIIPRPRGKGRRCDRYYLVELLGELLLVLCHFRWLLEEVLDDNDNDDHDIFVTFDTGRTEDGFKNYKFDVFKLDESKREWIQMKSIGDNILILGNCYSVSLPAHYYQGDKGNSIRIKEDLTAVIQIKSPSSWTIPTFRVFTPKTMVDLKYLSQ